LKRHWKVYLSQRWNAVKPVRKTPRMNALEHVPPVNADRVERRRDETAHRAILTAVVGLLDDEGVGLGGLTIEQVARRAGVSKATIYRWWRGKNELVVEAYAAKAARDAPVPDTGSVRQDLKELLGRLAYALTNLHSGKVMASLIIEANERPAFGEMFRRTMLSARRGAIMEVLERAHARGELRGDVDLPVVVDALYGAVYHRLLMSGEPIDGRFISSLTDHVLLGVINPARRGGPD
jgi:AcrR family transcriptional regulator